MRRILMTATLGLGSLLGTAGAFAGEEHCAPPHHRGPRIHARVRHPAPRCERVWVPPCTEQVVIGVDHCGKPITRIVVLREGYWSYRPVTCD